MIFPTMKNKPVKSQTQNVLENATLLQLVQQFSKLTSSCQSFDSLNYTEISIHKPQMSLKNLKKECLKSGTIEH